MMQPEDAKGEYAIDGGGSFMLVDGDNSPGLLAFEQRTAGIGRAEGLFEVHGGAEGIGFEVRKMALEDAFERAQITGACSIASGGSAALAIGYELKQLRLRLAETLRAEAECAAAFCRREDASNEVALVGPQVQGAAIVLGGEGVFIGAEVEEDLAIFEQSGLGVGVEKGLDRSSDFGRGLGLVRGRSSGRGHGVKVALPGFWGLGVPREGVLLRAPRSPSARDRGHPAGVSGKIGCETICAVISVDRRQGRG